MLPNVVALGNTTRIMPPEKSKHFWTAKDPNRSPIFPANGPAPIAINPYSENIFAACSGENFNETIR